MPRGKDSVATTLERINRELGTDEGSLVDMRIDVEWDGEIILSAGGVWNRAESKFEEDMEAETAVVARPHAGQIGPMVWFLSWLRTHAERRDNPPPLEAEDLEIDLSEDADLGDPTPDDEVYSAMFAGGRRGGKTWEAALLCVIYAVLFPNAIVWILNPSATKHAEVRRYISMWLHPDWVSRDTYAEGWDLINGSSLMLKSAYTGADPDAIKEGESHLVWMNEGQKMTERVFVVARGAVVDRSGIVLVCANPPVTAKDQDWVSRFAAEAQSRRRDAVYHLFNPLENPHVNRRSLLAMRKEMDIRTYRIEVLGEFLPPADRVAYNWIRTPDGNERKRPNPTVNANGVQTPCERTGLVDVTEEYFRSKEIGEGLTGGFGMDFQVFPYMGGPYLRIFCKPGVRPTRHNVLVWGVGEVYVEGDELAWSAAAISKGYQTDRTILVADATGEYQHSRRRNADSPPPEWEGKGSWDILREAGWSHITQPDVRFRKKNPDVLDRVRAMTSLIETAEHKRRLFLDPDLCPKTCQAIHDWPTVHGKPSRIHEAAHAGDGLSYFLIRIFPRHMQSDTPPPMRHRRERVQTQEVFGQIRDPRQRPSGNRRERKL